MPGGGAPMRDKNGRVIAHGKHTLVKDKAGGSYVVISYFGSIFRFHPSLKVQKHSLVFTQAFFEKHLSSYHGFQRNQLEKLIIDFSYVSIIRLLEDF